MSTGVAVASALVVLAGAWAARAAVRQVARALVLQRLGGGDPGWRWTRDLRSRRTPWQAARQERRYGHVLPVALDAVARSLRSGHSLRRAVADAGEGIAGPVGDDLQQVVASADAGRPLAAALDDWAAQRPRPDVLLVVAALGLAAETGAASAHAVEGVASTLRRRLVAAAEAHALGAQARASAVVLAAAPPALAVASVLGGGAAARFLLRTPVGVACLVVGLALDGLGAFWMARLTRAVGR